MELDLCSVFFLSSWVMVEIELYACEQQQSDFNFQKFERQKYNLQIILIMGFIFKWILFVSILGD